MKTKQKLQKVKMNLTLEKEFFDLLQQQADEDFIKVATWTKRFLKKNLLTRNKPSQSLTENEHAV